MTLIPSGTKFIGIDSAVPTQEKKSTSANAKQEVYTMADIAESVTGDSSLMLKTVVTSDNTALASAGTSPIELLPAVAGKYYVVDWDRSTMEFTTAGAGVVTGSTDHLVITDSSGYIFRRYADEGMAPSIGSVSIWNLGAAPSSFEVSDANNAVISSEFYPGEGIFFRSVNASGVGTNFTSVDAGCNMVFKIYYRLETIGA